LAAGGLEEDSLCTLLVLPWENKTVLAGEKGLKSILPIPLRQRRPQTNTTYKNNFIHPKRACKAILQAKQE